MHTVNKKIAVTPFPTLDAKVSVKGGVARLNQKSELSKLTVVYSDDSVYMAGDTVYVRSDLYTHQFAKETYELEAGKPFIVIDSSLVLLHALSDHVHRDR